jgi:hypothetical protein
MHLTLGAFDCLTALDGAVGNVFVETLEANAELEIRKRMHAVSADLIIIRDIPNIDTKLSADLQIFTRSYKYWLDT